MPAGIDLIPQEEIQEQKKVKLVKSGTVVAIILGILVGVISAGVIYVNSELTSQIKVLDESIAAHRAEVQSLQSIEVIARNLSKKYNTLKDLFDSKIYHSLLIREVEARKPESVRITSFTLDETGRLTISGDASDYLSVSQFVNNLANQNYTGGISGLGALFQGVTLNSVSLDKQSNSANYFIMLNINTSVLIR